MTIDTTVGTTTSNSYASVAEATAYLGVRGFTGTTWSALAQAQQESALEWAAIQLDTLYYVGTKTVMIQALEWPRFMVRDKNGYWIPGNVIPTVVKNAQIELAFQSITQDWSQGLGPILKDSVKVGTIEIGRQHHKAFPDAVIALLQQYLISNPNVGGRLVRG